MKFAFSTLGCPDWPWSEIVAGAKDLGYDGVELRAVEGEIYLPKVPLFAPERIAETRAALARRNLAVPCLTSACDLHYPDRREERLREGLDFVGLAARLGASFVRVLGDKAPQPTDPIDDSLVSEGLRILGEEASARGVMVLIETNGAYVDSARLRRVVEEARSPGVGVLWDVHHPYRFAGESFGETWEHLGSLIRYIHLKDSIQSGGHVTYKFLGDGDLPLAELPLLLKAGGYDGWLSLEWVKMWQRDLEEPGIVFPHFLGEARRLFGLG